ncbi:MAG: endonuclease III domain-containing protein [bacterium]|nr:MAG: endonuclease III domain-containing protein [bacterium]
MPLTQTLHQLYETLYGSYGSQRWWPAEGPFEVMLGAVLTQNTTWSGVEKAMPALKAACDMTPAGLLSLPLERLQEIVRPTGYFRQKALRLRNLCRFLLDRYGGDLALMDRVPTPVLRQEFLALHGIGPETADSILLYALNRPVFVVDAYTVRLLPRLGLADGRQGYREVQDLFMENLPPDTGLYNEYHALIVAHGKGRCRKQTPRCMECPLEAMCLHGRMRTSV